MPRFFGARLDMPPRQPERQSGRKPPENQADEILCPHPFSNSNWLSHGHCRGQCHFFIVFFVDVASPLEGRGSSSFCLSARLANHQLKGRRSTPVKGLRLGGGALLPWANGGIEPRLLPSPPPPPPQLSSFFAPLPLPPFLRRCHFFFAPLLLLPQRTISERPSSFGQRLSCRRHLLLLHHDPPPAPAPAAVITTPRRGVGRPLAE